jgi:hypothetical protein
MMVTQMHGLDRLEKGDFANYSEDASIITPTYDAKKYVLHLFACDKNRRHHYLIFQ